jgi:uncharacterized protein YegJ (DUF2314 family)
VANEFNILEFAGLANDAPWELEHPTATDLRAVVTNQKPTVEIVGKSIASFLGESISAEEIPPPDSDVEWAMRIRVDDLPNDILFWLEPINDATKDVTNIVDGWVLALQTILHADDPLTHFSNIMRLLGGIDVDIHSVCDVPTGRWFSNDIIDSVFVHNEVEPIEAILWMTRVVEAPEGGDPEDRWAWITTHGLTRCGRAELEMLGVPSVLADEAVHLVDGLAALTLETPLPEVGKTVSLGSNLTISLLECSAAIPMLEDFMPGKEDRDTPSVVVTSENGTTLCPIEPLNVLRTGETAVIKTIRSTNRQTTIATSQWNLFVQAVTHIGDNEHATCLAQVPWSNTQEEDSLREYLWFRVTRANDAALTGVLAHTPSLVTSLKEGHTEEITKEDISDWVLMTPVGPMGPSDAEAIEEFLDQFKN